MTRCLALLPILALASCTTPKPHEMGAIHLTMANRSREPQALEEVWIAQDAVRVHHDLGPDGTPKRITLARLDTGVVYEIDPAAKTYAEYRFDWLSAKMDKGDAGQYQVMPFEFTDVAGLRADGYIIMREGRGVGKVWAARDLEPEDFGSTAPAWQVYHEFRGFSKLLRTVPGVIVKQELSFPDYAYKSEAQAAHLIEELPPDLFELPKGYEKKPVADQ